MLFFMSIHSDVCLSRGFAAEVGRFVVVSEQMEKNFNRVLDYGTARVVYLIRERTPSDQRTIDETNKLLDEHDRKSRQNREDYIRENGGDRVASDEIFNTYLSESRARFFAVLTATERIYLSTYYRKEGRVRKEELLFKDSRPLPEIAEALQNTPDSVRGQIQYSVNTGNFSSRWSDGTHPLDSTEPKRREHTASTILDSQQTDEMRQIAELGMVRKSTRDDLNFLKFGLDSISPSDFKTLIEATKLDVSISEQFEGGEKVLLCAFGEKGENKVFYEMKLLPEKNFVIKSLILTYNNFVSLDYEFARYIEIEPNLWVPKHVVLKNRIVRSDVEDAFRVSEFLMIEPLQLGIELDSRLFDIHLTKEEKAALEKGEELTINRRATVIPVDASPEHENINFSRYIFFALGVVFIVLSFRLRKRKPE